MASRKRKTTWFRGEEEFADRRMLSVVLFVCIQKAATHDITRWNITECSKFQVYISYSFRVIIFLLKSWKKGLWTL